MGVREQVGLTAFAVGIPVLIGWVKWRVWDWLEERRKR